MITIRLFLIAVISLLFVTGLPAQVQQKLNIDEAIVFLKGAQLTSSAKLTLAKGENEILFTNVAGDVNGQSLTVNATNGIVVESATPRNDYLTSALLSPKAQEIKDSIALMNTYHQQLSNKVAVLAEQVAVLQENRKVGGANTGLSVAELTKMLDLISTKMEGYLSQQNKEEDLLKKTDERLAKLTRQLDEEQKKDYEPGGQLLVKFYAREATPTGITVTYIVPSAGWSPTYDIMADDANSPVKLFYKANIYQNTGVKWNNVHLTLSAGNPNEGAQAPAMNPWYLAFYMPRAYGNAAANKAVSVQGYKRPLVDMDKPDANMLANDEASMNQYVAVDNSGVNTTFDIDLPYTIPCDGQKHLVAIKRYELPATYRYYAVPKIDKDAFLQAQITNWEDLNLLPGQTNIFYEGTYVGQGMIDVRNVKDTMTLSLGRDKKIIVKRERDTKLRSVKTIGTNERETFAYSVSVRNTRRESINLILQDQLPVSNDKDIVVEEKETGDAEYDETTGMLKWALAVNTNETKKINFGFTVKYPKGKTITNLR